MANLLINLPADTTAITESPKLEMFSSVNITSDNTPITESVVLEEIEKGGSVADTSTMSENVSMFLVVYPYTQVVFNGLDINNAVEITETLVHDSAPTRNLNIYKIARRDGEKLVSAFFARKEIDVTGFIQSTSRQALEALIDNFKQQFQIKNGVLDIVYSSGIRRYYATFSSLDIKREPDNIDWTPYTVKFIVPAGFGQDVSQTSVSFNGITSSPYSNTFTNNGTASARATVTITVNSQSGMSALVFGNGTNNVTLTRSFSNADVVVINFDTFVVTVNGTPFSYTGSFAEWIAGANTFTMTVTASSFNANVEFDYYAAYL